MQIDSLSVSKGDTTKSLYNFLNSHYFQLIGSAGELKHVSGLLNDIYTGDFFGLLSSLGVNEKYHTMVAIANHVTGSSSYNGSLELLFIPSTELMDIIKRDFRSKTAN